MTFTDKDLKSLMEKFNVKGHEDIIAVTREMMGKMYSALLEGEMTNHLGYEKHDQANKNTTNARNGHSKKTVKTHLGEARIKVPRDRKGEFDPIVIAKNQTDVSGMESQIISMYGRGMSYRDIQDHLHEIYGIDVSPEFISNVTDKVIEMAREWQHRQLAQVYPIIFIDATFYNLKSANQVKNRPVYTIVGIDLDGKKERTGVGAADIHF